MKSLEAMCIKLEQKFPDVVLLLEMRDGLESNPATCVPTLITASIGDLYKDFKEMFKSQEPFFLHEVPTLGQCLLMVKAERHISKTEDGYYNHKRFPTDFEAYEEMRKRYYKVGGVLRYLFAKEEEYFCHYKRMMSEAANISSEIKKLTLINMPPTFKYFCALALREGATTGMFGQEMLKPSAKAEWHHLEDADKELCMDSQLKVGTNNTQPSTFLKFLSPAAAKLARIKCDDYPLRFLFNQAEFGWQLANILLQDFYLRGSDNLGEIPRMEWHIDPCWNGTPGLWKLDEAPDGMPAMNSLARLTCFTDQFVNVPVDKLHSTDLYMHDKHSGPLFDLLMVNHAMQRVYFLQSISETVSGREFSIPTLNRALWGLHMCKGQACENYTPVLIGVRDLFTPPSYYGLNFVSKCSDRDSYSANKVTSELGYNGDKALQCYILCMDVYPRLRSRYRYFDVKQQTKVALSDRTILQLALKSCTRKDMLKFINDNELKGVPTKPVDTVRNK